MFHLVGARDFAISETTGGLREALLAALTFRVNVLEATAGYLPPSWDILWSLSVEETFYLFFPIVCILLGRSRFMIGILAIFITLGPVGRTIFSQGNEVWMEYSYLGSMDAISLGVLTALVASRFRFSRSTLIWLGSVGISLLVFCLGCSRIANHWGFHRAGIDMTILAVGICMIIVASAQSQWRAPRLLAPLLKLGERSYEIYLTHMFVVIVFFDLFLRFEKPMAMVSVLFVASILISGFLGELVGRFYSEPLNLILRRSLKNKGSLKNETR